MQTANLVKPLLRGHIHQNAFLIALGACPLLILKSSNATSLLSALVYSLGLLFMLGVSALYHRVHWSPKLRARMKRLDHSAIFILIASTMTPVCLFAIKEDEGVNFLIFAWVISLIGILQSVLWVKAPKYVTAILYIAMGWLVLPYFPELQAALSTSGIALLLAGGIVYTLGGIIYALKWPKFYPNVFGYHELFHLFTVVAAIMHFMVVYQIIN